MNVEGNLGVPKTFTKRQKVYCGTQRKIKKEGRLSLRNERRRKNCLRKENIPSECKSKRNKTKFEKF